MQRGRRHHAHSRRPCAVYRTPISPVFPCRASTPCTRHARRCTVVCMCFCSVPVDLEAEVALKNLAAQQGVLVMGPDCGTAVLNGIPLGFANHLPRGPVGLIAASGTGLQQVSCLLARQGIGASQAIGVGGRDVHERIGGHSMRAALQALAQDPDTRVLVLIAKPPAASVAARLAQEAAQTGKPCVLAFVGDTVLPNDSGGVYTATTLEEAALIAGALAQDVPLPTG